ncbi:MAG: hypothetical protein NT138_09075 [Planctomycetales bacterium]|nr:hypothetical protein [Planctomycetales bacterium]
MRSSGTEISSQYEQLEACAAQVSEDLEELTWLRNLTNHLELSESGNSVEQIAETVLPSLCKLMNAHVLIFVRDVAVTGLNSRLPVIWQARFRYLVATVWPSSKHCLERILTAPSSRTFPGGNSVMADLRALNPACQCP